MRAIERKGEEERRPEVDARVQRDWRALVNLKELMPWRTVNLIGNMAYFGPVPCHFDFGNKIWFVMIPFALTRCRKQILEGGSPGLVVMGRDSCFKGRGFESWHHILDGHFFTFICCKNFNVC